MIFYPPVSPGRQRTVGSRGPVLVTILADGLTTVTLHQSLPGCLRRARPRGGPHPTDGCMPKPSKCSLYCRPLRIRAAGENPDSHRGGFSPAEPCALFVELLLRFLIPVCGQSEGNIGDGAGW